MRTVGLILPVAILLQACVATPPGPYEPDLATAINNKNWKEAAYLALSALESGQLTAEDYQKLEQRQHIENAIPEVLNIVTQIAINKEKTRYYTYPPHYERLVLTLFPGAKRIPDPSFDITTIASSIREQTAPSIRSLSIIPPESLLRHDPDGLLNDDAVSHAKQELLTRLKERPTNRLIEYASIISTIKYDLGDSGNYRKNVMSILEKRTFSGEQYVNIDDSLEKHFPEAEITIAGVDPSAMSVKGFKLTMPYEILESQLASQDISCREADSHLPNNLFCSLRYDSDRTQTYAGIPANISYQFHCDKATSKDGCRLYGAHIDLPSHRFSHVEKTLTAKFGEPERQRVVTKQNRLGATFKSRVLDWTIGDSIIIGEELGSKVDRSNFTVLYEPIVSEMPDRQLDTGDL